MKLIPLLSGKFAVVDDEDFERLISYEWREVKGSTKVYAGHTYHPTNGSTVTVLMHRMILGLRDRGVNVDHINGNGLDNRKTNLRLASASQNLANRGVNRNNTSGFKGVSFIKGRRKYEAKITINRRTVNLGRFSDPSEAARSYDRAATKFFGKFAITNKSLGLL